MPGSPPSSSTEPRTKPPPVTRSNSAMPGRQPRRVLRFARQAARARTGGPCAARGRASAGALRRRSLGDGVPFAAGVALALPAAIGGAAVLADEALVATGHGEGRTVRVDSRPQGWIISPCKRGDSAGRDWSAPRSRWCPARRRDRRPSMPSPISVASSPRRTVPSGRSVTSTPNRSMETRPTIGQRLPATTTSAAGLPLRGAGRAQKSVGVADGDDRDAARSRRRPGRAVADGVALLEVAHLDDAALEVDHRAHRVLASGRGIGAEQRDAGPHQVAVNGAAEKDAGGIGDRGGNAAIHDADFAKQRICRSFSGWSGVSAQAKWLISSVKPCFSDWMRGAIATASSGVMPSRFMPVSTCSAAPPRQLLLETNASHSASSVVLLITGRRLASANEGAEPGISPLST